jgi:hypothetical protein
MAISGSGVLPDDLPRQRSGEIGRGRRLANSRRECSAHHAHARSPLNFVASVSGSPAKSVRLGRPSRDPAFLAAGFGVTIHQFGGKGIWPVSLAATHGIDRYSLTLRSLSLAKTESTSMPASGSAFSTPAVPKTPASLTGSLSVSHVVTSLGTRV